MGNWSLWCDWCADRKVGGVKRGLGGIRIEGLLFSMPMAFLVVSVAVMMYEWLSTMEMLRLQCNLYHRYEYGACSLAGGLSHVLVYFWRLFGYDMPYRE